jgi:hypothetical protein
MTRAEELVAHEPPMAEMAGAATESTSHVHVEKVAADAVPPGLAALEAETEED